MGRPGFGTEKYADEINTALEGMQNNRDQPLVGATLMFLAQGTLETETDKHNPQRSAQLRDIAHQFTDQVLQAMSTGEVPPTDVPFSEKEFVFKFNEAFWNNPSDKRAGGCWRERVVSLKWSTIFDVCKWTSGEFGRAGGRQRNRMSSEFLKEDAASSFGNPSGRAVLSEVVDVLITCLMYGWQHDMVPEERQPRA